MKVLQFPVHKIPSQDASAGSHSASESSLLSDAEFSDTDNRQKPGLSLHLEIKRHREQIASLSEAEAAGNPWIAGVYEQLGRALFKLAVEEKDTREQLSAAEAAYQEALRLSSLHGDLPGAARCLTELGAISKIFGDAPLSEERYERAAELQLMQTALKMIPEENRLKYNHPAVPKILSAKEVSGFEAELGTIVEEELKDFSELQKKRVQTTLYRSIDTAVQQGRWIDDAFVIMLSQDLVANLLLTSAELNTNWQEAASQISYKALGKAARFFDLGLKEETLHQLAARFV